ncbi:MAG: PEP-CTERM sorting domain-containing protein [Candidatus Krumholzibacteria bacterium]|nr:PEP-CTERM sorting domain-containing protein [Candidatus Krumholzibacteria bacterium]
MSVTRSLARAVSINGEVIVGQFYPENSSSPVAFRWTISTGMVALVDTAAGFERGQAFDVSSDGQYIVGVGSSSITPNQAFRWNASTGVTWLGWLSANLLDSFAYGTSADGSAICGLSFSGDEFGVEVFRWTEADGIVGLGDVPGGLFYAIPHGISEDGTTIVGQTRVSASMEEIFIWREGTGYILPDSAHGYSVATSTTHDGSIVAAGGPTIGPVLWDDQNGFRNFADILTDDYGLDIDGWSAISIAAVSADGTTFAGEGINPDGNREGWFARLPVPSAVNVPTPVPRHRFSVTLAGANPFVSRAAFRLQSDENLSDVRA